MEEFVYFPKWDELVPEALGLIFKNLSLVELLTVVPMVCKSWERVVAGPYCWEEIDIEEWSKYKNPETVDRMIQMLVTRSCGSLQKLVVSGLKSDQSFLFIANHAQSLTTLRLPRSEINDSIIGNASGLLSNITFLDLSYSIQIGALALKIIGQNCKFLTSLRRTMHPLEVVDKLSQSDEALAIASTMPRLKHLEIAYLLVDTSSVVEILKNCTCLELLDVRGCWNVNLDEEFVKGFPRLKVVGPHVVDYSGPSGYLPWDFVAGDGFDDEEDPEMDGLWDDEGSIEGVEIWFYDNNAWYDWDAGNDWPQSP